MYKLNNISSNYLLENGFRRLSDGSYVLHFPVYKWHGTPTSFCNAYINPDESKQITLEVIRADGSLHIHWYEKNYIQANKLLKAIDKAIDIKMHKIGARHYADR